MKLYEFFDLLGQHPEYILGYFILLPVVAYCLWWVLPNNQIENRSRYLYSILVYMVAIPGIFALTLDIYVFLFEHRSVFETDILTQVLPVVSLVVTLVLVRKNIEFDAIPGFGRLSSFLVAIFGLMTIMWFLEKTRIWAITFLPIQYIGIIFLIAIAGILYGTGKVFKK